VGEAGMAAVTEHAPTQQLDPKQLGREGALLAKKFQDFDDKRSGYAAATWQVANSIRIAAAHP